MINTKIYFAAIVVVLAAPVSGRAGAYIIMDDQPYEVDVGCDSNKNTPAEVVDCKLKYWRSLVDGREKTLAEDQKSLDEARDRVRAFEAAKRP